MALALTPLMEPIWSNLIRFEKSVLGCISEKDELTISDEAERWAIIFLASLSTLCLDLRVHEIQHRAPLLSSKRALRALEEIRKAQKNGRDRKERVHEKINSRKSKVGSQPKFKDRYSKSKQVAAFVHIAKIMNTLEGNWKIWLRPTANIKHRLECAGYWSHRETHFRRVESSE